MGREDFLSSPTPPFFFHLARHPPPLHLSLDPLLAQKPQKPETLHRLRAVSERERGWLTAIGDAALAGEQLGHFSIGQEARRSGRGDETK